MTALRKLLVVDDDPVVGASFNRVLSGKGYVVVSAENGQEALDKLKSDKFDAVFTDLRMPGMDGLQVAEKVRAAQPWIPVVIVTGYGSPASEARARAAGVSEFLHKPLSPEMIEDSAEKAVRTVFEGVTAPAGEAALPQSSAAVAPAAQEQARGGVLSVVKNMLLFLAGPFIGLLYAVLLPFVGMGMLLWVATEGLRKRKAGAAAMAEPAPVCEAPEAPAPAPAAATQAAAPARPMGPAAAAWLAVKLVAGVIAAPFIGLAFIVVMPFVGLAALAWTGLKSAFPRAG